VFFLATWSATEPAEPTSTGGSGEGGRAADRLLAGHLGGVNVVQTLHQGEILMGVGALGDDDLADLVESALP
jgi:hypothetical protein